jgi:hypothetical protein
VEEETDADPEGLNDPYEVSGWSCLAVGVILTAFFIAVIGFPIWPLLGMAGESGGRFERWFTPVLFVSPLLLLLAVLLAAASLWTKNRVLLGLGTAMLLIVGIAFAPLFVPILQG